MSRRSCASSACPREATQAPRQCGSGSPAKISSGSRQSREVSRCASGGRPVPSRKASVGAMKTATSGRKVQGRNTYEPQHTIPIEASDVLGLVVATAIATSTAQEQRLIRGSSTRRREHSRRRRGSLALPPGATVEPVARRDGLEPRLSRSRSRPGATVEPVVASTGQLALPAGATVEPVAASTVPPGGVQVAPALPSPVVEVRAGSTGPMRVSELESRSEAFCSLAVLCS